MIGRLEASPDWSDTRDKMDVLKMLELLQKVTYSYEGGQNYYHALISVKKNQMNSRQGDMSTDSYKKAFLTAVDILESCGGSVALDPGTINRKIAVLDPGKDSTTASEPILKKAQEKLKEEYLAVQFLLGCYLQRHGKLFEEVDNSYTGGNKNSYLLLLLLNYL